MAKLIKVLELTKQKDKNLKKSKSTINLVTKAHINYLKEQKALGNLVFSGRSTDNTGGLIIYQGKSTKKIEFLIKADPLYKADLIEINVHPFESLEQL